MNMGKYKADILSAYDLTFSKYAQLKYGAFIEMSPPEKPKKLLDQVRDVLRVKHYAYRTEKTFIFWIRRYILFHDKRHPKEMGSKQIEELMTDLAVKGNVAASTQN